MATKKSEPKPKPRYSEKWKKDFGKRYSNVIKELKALENEYNEMAEANPDKYISKYSINIDDSVVEFKNADTGHVYHNKNVEDENEYVEISFGTGLSSFAGKFYDLKELIEFRNDLTEAIDAFKRPIGETKDILTDDCEDEEGWEDNEYQEYVIVASRSCVQSWTHTVQARSSCEAYRLVQEDPSSSNDENDDYDDYGEITWEIQ